MKHAIDWISLTVCCFALSAMSAAGNSLLTVKDCWKDRADAPQTELSDLGVVGFMSYARVANLDSRLENRLAQVKLMMKFSNIPENVIRQKETIPATLAEAAVYLSNNVCMAYPPVLCVETDEAFYACAALHRRTQCGGKRRAVPALRKPLYDRYRENLRREKRRPG